jgi:hypothetical protein
MQSGKTREAERELLDMAKQKQIVLDNFVELYIDLVDLNATLKAMSTAAHLLFGTFQNQTAVPLKLIQTILDRQKQASKSCKPEA